MLSTENPPPDLPCPCSSSDERSFPSHDKLASADPDLSKFSIRDYVFTARRKDIKKNWPFSVKNLQLCLKHGVSDVLPPFGSTDTARNQSLPVRYTVGADLGKENCLVQDDASGDVGLSEKLVDPCTTDGGESDQFPSTTTSVSVLSELESVTANNNNNKLCSTQSEVDTSLVEVQAAISTPPTRPLVKKCRLVVKFGASLDRSSTEDIVSTTTAMSETMASKVCPVCKTFSSSSNTTLNAHIDQCLSGESSNPKWTSDFKLSRHRVKPRKTRLMVDVYSAAKRCTLEELDRRNGTNWATISGLLPPQDIGTVPAEGRKQSASQVHPKETGDVGAVYIDSSGTKVRILSKSSDAAPVVSRGEGAETTKPFKGDKLLHKLLSTKKKMKHVLKDQKYLKLSPQSKKLRSYSEHKSQIDEDREKCSKIQNFKTIEHAKPSDRGSLGQWVCSKRTGLSRKVKSNEGQDLMVQTERVNVSDSLSERSRVHRLSSSSDNAISFAEVSDRMESPLHEGGDSGTQWSPGKKRMRSSLAVPRTYPNAEKAFSSMKQKTDHPSKGTTWKPSSCIVNHASALVSKAAEGRECSTIDSDTSPRANTKPSKAMRLSSLRKELSPLSESPPGTKSKYKFSAIKKSSAYIKSQTHVMVETDKESVIWRSKLNQPRELMQTCILNQSVREYFSDDEDSQTDEAMVDVDEGKSVDFSDRNSYDTFNEYDSIDFATKSGQTRGEDTVSVDVSSSKVAAEDSLACSSKSQEPVFHKAGNCIEDYNTSLHGEETQTRTCDNEPNFVDGPAMFSGDGDENGINVQNLPQVEQDNSFLEIDPIPIPGPPGSFLPSPGGDDSSEEDFQGNSSLTTSRFQSSQDQRDNVSNRGSLDSPVSATSSISNPTAARFDANYTEPLSAGSCTTKDKFGSGFFSVDIEPSVENACTEAERFTTDGETLKGSKVPIEKGRLNTRNDDQPCCCSRKERVSQADALNYEESQLLRRRAIASMTVPAVGKQASGNPNSRIDDVGIMRPEVLLPLSSSRSSGSEKVFSPVTTPSPLQPPLDGASDVGAKLSGRGDCSPSAASNPVLRLMGKNLMVVNKAEAVQAPSPSHAHDNRQSSHFPSFPGSYPGNVRNQDYNSFLPFINQGLVNFSQDPHNSVGQPFDVRMSNGFGSHSSFQSTSQAPVGAQFQNQYIGGSFGMYAEPCEYRDERIRLKSVPNGGASMYNVEKVETSANQKHNTSAVASNVVKEIIIIDDGAENEAAKHVTGSRGRILASYGVPAAPSHGSPYANPFSTYHQPRDGSRLDESTTLQGVRLHAPSSAKRANTSPARWNCTSEGPPGMQQRTLYNGAVPPPPTSHLRSALYYSPSLS